MFGPRLCEGPMNLGLSIRTHVHFSHSIFLRTGLLIFLIFCMKLTDHIYKYSKLTEPIFLGNFSLARKQSKYSPIVCYYSIFLRISSLFFFLIFCMKLRDHKYSKLRELDFLKKFSLAGKQAKMTQNTGMTLGMLGEDGLQQPPQTPQLHFQLWPFLLNPIFLKQYVAAFFLK